MSLRSKRTRRLAATLCGDFRLAQPPCDAPFSNTADDEPPLLERRKRPHRVVSAVGFPSSPIRRLLLRAKRRFRVVCLSELVVDSAASLLSAASDDALRAAALSGSGNAGAPPDNAGGVVGGGGDGPIEGSSQTFG